jgi:hypothetical protein
MTRLLSGTNRCQCEDLGHTAGSALAHLERDLVQFDICAGHSIREPCP